MIDGGLRSIFASNLRRGFHWQAIESGGTNRGIPDANACSGGIEFWVEYKKTNGNGVPLRPEQVGWIERRVRAGGRVFVAIRLLKNNRDTLLLFHGKFVRPLYLSGLKVAKPLGEWEGGPSSWNWDEVSSLLRSVKF